MGRQPQLLSPATELNPVRQLEASAKLWPIDFGAGSDRGGRDGHGIAFAILFVTIDPVGGGCVGADVGEAQPVGKTGSPHIHGHSPS
jgi:hypothetical protein